MKKNTQKEKDKAGSVLWNSLSEQLRQPDITFRQFKRSLKTFMFG